MSKEVFINSLCVQVYTSTSCHVIQVPYMCMVRVCVSCDGT